jgi:hypothetical protein
VEGCRNTVMNFRVPKNAGKFLNSCTTGGFSRRAQLNEVITQATSRLPVFDSQKGLLSSSQCSCRLWSPSSPRPIGNRNSFSGIIRLGCKRRAISHQLQRVHGNKTPLSYTHSCRGTQFDKGEMLPFYIACLSY